MATMRVRRPLPIEELAAELGLEPDEVEPYGRSRRSSRSPRSSAARTQPDGRLVSVTSITPTPAGEGKTTTAIGLVDALARIGERPLLCLREPSLGPVFGIKGGGTGGGRRSSCPWTRSTSTSRATSTRSARRTTCSRRCSRPPAARERAPARPALDHLAPLPRHGRPRAAQGRRRARRPHERRSARDRLRHHRRLGGDGDRRRLEQPRRPARGGSARSPSARPRRRARDRGGARRCRLDGRPARGRAAAEPRADVRGQPALVHCGPFANIAHGNNSLLGTRLGLHLADWVVTESGFGADMGFEKLLDIVCATAGSRRARSSSSRP